MKWNQSNMSMREVKSLGQVAAILAQIFLRRNSVKMKQVFLHWTLGAWLLLGSHPGHAQAFEASDALAGQVRDQLTQQPLGYVSVGVLRHPFGTVADNRGRFVLALPARYDADSVRFSLLGYATRTLAVAELRRVVRNGTVLLRRAAWLQDISFKVTHCTYDTVYLRLNVYQVGTDDFPGANLLAAPLYLRVGRAEIDDRIFVNMRPYKLWITTDVIVSLELVRTLGKGTLAFLANWPGGGPSYHLEQTPGPLSAKSIPPKGTMEAHVAEVKQPNQGPWTKYPRVGVGIEAALLELPE